MWLESITAIPSDSFDDDYLEPERIAESLDYAQQCGQNHFYTDPQDEGEKMNLNKITEYAECFFFQ